MNFRIITEYPDQTMLAAWREFLSHAEYPTHYTTPGFFIDPFIRGGKRFAVLVLEDEKVNAVLTAVDAGKEIVSGFPVRPQTAFRENTYHSQAAKSLVEGLLERGGDDLELVNFHTWEQIGGLENLNFRAERCIGDDAVVMLDLSKGAEALFVDFSETRQSEIRKAIKKNALTIKEVETEGELKELYDVHLKWCAVKNVDADCLEDFTTAINDKEYRKTLIAVHDGKVIAGTFFRFCPGGVVEYAGNNSMAEYQSLCPNPLIGWRAIEWASENNFTHFSMGASHEFLRRFGGEIHCAWRYTLDRTFFKRHQNKELLKNLAVKTYLSLPVRARQGIKRAFGR